MAGKMSAHRVLRRRACTSPSHVRLLCLVITGAASIAFAGTAAHAASYYLDAASGDDGNPGTSELPWKTISKAQSVVQSGDTAILRTGNYGAFSQSNVTYTDWVTYKAEAGQNPIFTKIEISNSNQQDSYLRFDGINIQHPSTYWPTPDGHWHYNDPGAPGNLIRVIRANYVQFLNGTYKGYEKYISQGAYFAYADNSLIENCEISTIVEGIKVEKSKNVTVRHCNVHDMSEGSGIRFETECDGALIETTHLYDQRREENDTYNPYLDEWHTGSGFAIRSSHFTIRKNIVHGGFAQGLMFYGPQTYHDMIVENNLFYDTGPVRFINLDGSCIVRNNTGIGYIGDTRITSIGYIQGRYIGQPLQVSLATGFNGDGVKIYNNVCVGYWDLLDPTDSNLKHLEDYNIVWRGPYIGGVYLSYGKGVNTRVLIWKESGIWHGWPNYFEDTGCRMDTPEYDYDTDGIQAFFVDPNYWTDMINPENGSGCYQTHDYHLAAGSPGINSGASTVATYTQVLNGEILGPSQPPDSLGTIGPDGFIRDDGRTRDASHHSAGCYEYTVGNQTPTADAGPDEAVTDSDENGSEQISLDGSGSTDPDGTIVNYVWTEGGTQVATGVTATVTLSVGVHTIVLTVTDDGGLTATDTVMISIVTPGNQAPIADAGADQTVADSDGNGSEQISLDGSGSTDPDGTISSYVWTEGGTQIATGASANVTLSVGQHTITLTVADNGGLMATDTVTISIAANQTPTANAGPRQTLTDLDGNGSEQTTLDGSGSTDPDGTITSYVWTEGSSQIATGVNPTVTLSVGIHTITLIVTDNGGLTGVDATTITIHAPDNSAPSVTNCSPSADTVQVPSNNLTILHIIDAGRGIDASSVIIRVNNNTVYSGDIAHYSSTYGSCRRTGTIADYMFTYQPSEMFDFEQKVTVAVNATDLAGNMMDEYTYSFWTEMRSFGANKWVSWSLDGLNNTEPATVCDNSGDIWVVWHAGPTGSRDIYVSKLTDGTDDFGNSLLLADSPADQCSPAIALDGNDNMYVVWQDNRRGNWDIYVSTSADGITWSAESRVTDSNDNETNPAVAVDGTNNAHIVWQDDRQGNQDIYLASSSDNFGTETPIASGGSEQVQPAIAVAADNTIYVVWTDLSNGSGDIYGAASSDSWTNVAVVSNANGQSSPVIGTESTGSGLHLLWVDDTPGNKDIYYAATTSGLAGTPLTGSSVIDPGGAAEQLQPVIAVMGAGEDLKAFACWQDKRNADTDLYFVRANSDGGTNVFVGDDGTNSNQSEPAIGIDKYGHPYLVWTDDRNSNTDIYCAASTFVDSVPLASELVSASAPEATTVGTEPSAINSLDDVSVVIPAGACSCDVEITICRIKNPQAFAVECLAAYDFGPSGIEFNQPVTITIPYEFSGSDDSATPYWFNALSGALTQQGITDIQDIVITPSLHALSFKTTHFTAFYLLLGSTGAAGGGGGGGGCSISATGDGNATEFLLPYIGLIVAIATLKLRDARHRNSNPARSGC